MFDLDLIESALDDAATCGYDEARAEFDRLRKAIDEAPVSWIDMNRWGKDWPDDCVGVDGMDGCNRVLLVKCDE